jgi:hypothetical protein
MFNFNCSMDIIQENREISEAYFDWKIVKYQKFCADLYSNPL